MERAKRAYKEFYVDRKLGKQLLIGPEPHYLFVITPPYSGSTALAQVLNSAPSSALLQERGEGQWLVPGMGCSDRWDESKKIDWKGVRIVWEKRIALLRALVQNVEVIIEKSPPNMVRVDDLVSVFPNHTLLAFNRNPYANCSSILFRHYNVEMLNEKERNEAVASLADAWIKRSNWVRKAIEEKGALHFTYEGFCSDTQGCIDQLSEKVPAFQDVDIERPLYVKDYEPQKISDQNSRQISKLSPEDVVIISQRLNRDSELVSYFGYKIIGDHD